MLLHKLFDPIVTFLAVEHGRSSPGKSADRSQWHHPLPIKEVNQAKGNHRRLAKHSRTFSKILPKILPKITGSQWHYSLPIKEVNQVKGNLRRLAKHSRTFSKILPKILPKVLPKVLPKILTKITGSQWHHLLRIKRKAIIDVSQITVGKAQNYRKQAN